MAALQDSEGHFRIIVEALPHIAWMTDPQGIEAHFNQRWHDFTGLGPGAAAVSAWLAAIHPDERPGTEKAWIEALSQRRPLETEHRVRSADGAYRWFATRAVPVRSPAGDILHWFATMIDVEQRKRAETALGLLQEQHRIALEAAEIGTWEYDSVAGRLDLDEQACALVGMAPDCRGVAVDDLLGRVHDEDRSQVRASLEAAAEADFEIEFRVMDGNRPRWLQVRGRAWRNLDHGGGRPSGSTGIVRNITERRTGDEARLQVARELNHRVKNLFAIANGLVSMTARSAKDPKEMAEALRGRLGALSRAHELARPTFGADEQPGQATTLGRLIASILGPYAQAGQDARLTLDGPQVSLGANAVTSLGLVLHELATNAAKYGSLSQADGTLAIRWTSDGDQVAISWTEDGGPPVSETPMLQGFGSQLSRKSITGQLAGSLDYDWRPRGLRVRIALPRDRISI